MTIRPLREAEYELDDARVRYDRYGPGDGRQFLIEYHAAITTILAQPDRYPLVDSPRGAGPIRGCPIPGRPHTIYYSVDDDTIWVWAIAHASQEPNYWHRRNVPRHP